MNILVDAGNSFVKLAMVDVQGNIERLSLNEFIKLTVKVKQVVYSSVKDSTDLQQILTYCKEAQIPTQQAAVSSSFKELTCGYELVDNLGIDRWLAVIGARMTNPEHNLIVVDAGTAITIDVCVGNSHLGGWISPGFKLMQDSIIEKAPGVFTQSTIEKEVFGTSTPSALFHGCLFSLVGMIEKAFLLTEKMNNQAIKIIVTGGDAELICENLSQKSLINKDLVFVGLKQFLK